MLELIFITMQLNHKSIDSILSIDMYIIGAFIIIKVNYVEVYYHLAIKVFLEDNTINALTKDTCTVPYATNSK